MNANILYIVIVLLIIVVTVCQYGPCQYGPCHYVNSCDIMNFGNYLQATDDGWNYILPQDFHKMDKSKFFILDIRKPDDYKKGHIKGAVNIFWLDLMKPDNIKRLPKDKQIIVVCYVGHTASQILVLLKLLGYNAKALKFGMGLAPNKNVPIAGWTTLGYDTVKS
jgi:rhodanese-related sulfurtransferase